MVKRAQRIRSWPGVIHSNKGRIHLLRPTCDILTFRLRRSGGPYIPVCPSSVPKFAASANGTERSERADAKGVTDNELRDNRNLGGTIQRRPGSRKRLRDYNRPMPLPGDGSSRSEQLLDILLVVDRFPAFTRSTHQDGSVEFVNQ